MFRRVLRMLALVVTCLFPLTALGAPPVEVITLDEEATPNPTGPSSTPGPSGSVSKKKKKKKRRAPPPKQVEEVDEEVDEEAEEPADEEEAEDEAPAPKKKK